MFVVMVFDFYVMMIFIVVMFSRFPKKINNTLMSISCNMNSNQKSLWKSDDWETLSQCCFGSFSTHHAKAIKWLIFEQQENLKGHEFIFSVEQDIIEL